MAAGLGFKTFVTGEVLTAADTNGYLMQGVNVFASAAARSAAITSPQEGQMSYLKDTDVTQYYNGSTWVSIGGSSGLTLISSTTIGSAVSSISLANNTFSSTYNNYRVIFDCSQTTAISANPVINFRYRAGGVDDSGASYNYTGYEGTSALTAVNQAGVTSNRLGKALGATPDRFSAIIDLFGIFTSAQTMHQVNFSGMDGGTNMSGTYGGFSSYATSFDSMTFILSTGTMTNGRIRVYGYSNS